MQTYQIKSELNVLVNSTNNKLEAVTETPFCRKKLDFQPLSEKKADSIKSFEVSTTSMKKCQFAKMPSNSKRNARERRRVRTINDYFSQLQKFLPHTKQTNSGSTGLATVKKMSKVETLKAAIEYIEFLQKFAPANSQQMFQLSKTGSSPSSLMSSPASSICSNTTQILTEKFKTTLNKNCSSPNNSKVTSCSPSTIQNTSSTCSTPKSNCAEAMYTSSQPQYQNAAYPSNYYNYSECNYYNNVNYYYNNQGYNGYHENYENNNNSFNCYYQGEAGSAQANVQMSPVNNKSNMSSCSSSSLSSTTGSNFYAYNNEVKSEYYLNDCEAGLNI